MAKVGGRDDTRSGRASDAANRRDGAAAAIAGWDRRRMLPRLIPVGPEELGDESREGRAVIVGRLMRALRGERVRGRAGHWSYSLDRHIGLVQALAAERRGLTTSSGEASEGRSRHRRP